jgi:hypothetical protein
VTDPSKVTKSIGCFGSLEGTPISFSYTAHLFANGNIFATAAIRDRASEVSYSSLYSPSQVGAATAEVLLVDDLLGSANSGYWSLSLNRSTLVTTIVYNDVDAQGGTQTWTMDPSKCVANTYP